MQEELRDQPGFDKRQLKDLSQRSDALGLRQLAAHLGLLLLTGILVLWTSGSLWVLPSMVVHGVALVFLFAPLHESVHRTAFRNKVLNDVVAYFCGWVLLLPPDYFRFFHFAHHRHTQNPRRDPELAVPKPESLLAYLWQMSGLPYIRERLNTFCTHATGLVSENFIPRSQGKTVIREARIYLATYAGLLLFCLIFWTAVPFLLWLFPLILGQPALRLYLLAEHCDCPLVPDMLKNSRTTATNPAVRFLAWNMPYHAEHHAYPALPFHALPKAHALLSDNIVVTAPGYLAVHRDVLRRLVRSRTQHSR